MNREIKFRAWDGKEMLCDLAVGNHCVASLNPIGKSFVRDESEYRAVMQFTGLKDKNGNEIYEGDIVKWRSHPKPMQIGETVWFQEAARWETKWQTDFDRQQGIYSSHSFWALNHVEVIGNIYENPELL